MVSWISLMNFFSKCSAFETPLNNSFQTFGSERNSQDYRYTERNLKMWFGSVSVIKCQDAQMDLEDLLYISVQILESSVVRNGLRACKQ